MEEPPGMNRFSIGIILAALFLSGPQAASPKRRRRSPLEQPAEDRALLLESFGDLWIAVIPVDDYRWM